MVNNHYLHSDLFHRLSNEIIDCIYKFLFKYTDMKTESYYSSVLTRKIMDYIIKGDNVLYKEEGVKCYGPREG